MNDFYSYSFGEFTIYQTPNLWRTYQSYNYILAKGSNAIVFDPGEYGPIAKTLESNNLKLHGVYLTHHHKDHVGAAREFAKKWDCPIIGFAPDQKRLPPISIAIEAEEEFTIFDQPVKAMFLPGHTLGLIAYYWPKQNFLFSNDLLFSLGCGRVFEGTHEQMHASLKRVTELPEETVIFPSHEYTGANLNFAAAVFDDDPRIIEIQNDIVEKINSKTPTVPTTLGFEKKHNPFLRWADPYIRQKLNLESAQDWQVFAQIRLLKDNS